MFLATECGKKKKTFYLFFNHYKKIVTAACSYTPTSRFTEGRQATFTDNQLYNTHLQLILHMKKKQQLWLKDFTNIFIMSKWEMPHAI